MKTRLLFVVLAVLLVAVSVTAGDHSLTTQVRNFEHARKIDRAYIEAMIQPEGSFTVTFWGINAAGQCPINPSHEFTINLRPDIDGIYINTGCPHEGPIPCFCDIYVRTPDTKQAWEDAMAPYQQEYKRTLPIDPGPDAKVYSGGISYSTGANANYTTLELNPVANVNRGDEFTLAVDAWVSRNGQSPCGDPNGRPCQLTTELWQVLPDGKREMLRSEFELDEMPKVWLKAGERTRVSLRGRFPHPDSYYPVPKGKAVLVAKWFLWKYRWSLADYQVPVGGFEIPLNIK